METFVMTTRLAHGQLRSPPMLENLEKQVTKRIRQECPEVEWIQSFAVLGPYDYVDIFKAPNLETAAKVGTMVRTFGHAHTELWPAIPWGDFKQLIRDLPTLEE